MRNLIRVVIFILFPFAMLTAEDINDTDVRVLFTGMYEDPVISETVPGVKIPGLRFFSVFERKNLNEDPLVPRKWILVNNSKLYRSGDIVRAINEVKYMPGSEEEALTAALFIAEFYFSNYHIMQSNETDTGLVPPEFLSVSLPPEVIHTADRYFVIIYVASWDRHIMFKPKNYELQKYSLEFLPGRFSIAMMQNIRTIRKK